MLSIAFGSGIERMGRITTWQHEDAVVPDAIMQSKRFRASGSGAGFLRRGQSARAGALILGEGRVTATAIGFAIALYDAWPRNALRSLYSGLAFLPPSNGSTGFHVWDGHFRGNAHSFIAERLRGSWNDAGG